MICASPGVLINACSHGKKESACWVLQIKTIKKKKSQVLVKFYIFKKPQIKKQDVIYTVYFFLTKRKPNCRNTVSEKLNRTCD